MELTWNTLGQCAGHDMRLFGMGRSLSSGKRDVRALVLMLDGTVGGGGNWRLWVHVRSVGWTGGFDGGHKSVGTFPAGTRPERKA